MPKVDRDLLADATLNTVGCMNYWGREYLSQIKEARRLAGITKGQWKRMIVAGKKSGWDCEASILHASALSVRKLEVMRVHGDSPHLETLLKMVEAQYGDEP